MPALRSSNLASCDYNAETRELTITFKSGATYTYHDRDQAIYDGLLSASSPGKYFADNIKDVGNPTKG